MIPIGADIDDEGQNILDASATKKIADDMWWQYQEFLYQKSSNDMTDEKSVMESDEGSDDNDSD